MRRMSVARDVSGRHQNSTDPVYRVVSPIGKTAGSDPTKLAPPVSDLAGKRVGEVWNHNGKGERVFPIVREQIRRRYPGVEFIDYRAFGDTHGPKEREVMADLPNKLRELGVDVVISGLGV